MYGQRDYLHCQKRPLYMGMGIFCTAKKPSISGYGHIVHYQKALFIWVRTHFALLKSSPYMGMGICCTAKKIAICGNGQSLHDQKALHIWACKRFALPKSPLHLGMGIF